MIIYSRILQAVKLNLSSDSALFGVLIRKSVSEKSDKTLSQFFTKILFSIKSLSIPICALKSPQLIAHDYHYYYLS